MDSLDGVGAIEEVEDDAGEGAVMEVEGARTMSTLSPLSPAAGSLLRAQATNTSVRTSRKQHRQVTEGKKRKK